MTSSFSLGISCYHQALLCAVCYVMSRCCWLPEAVRSSCISLHTGQSGARSLRAAGEK